MNIRKITTTGPISLAAKFKRQQAANRIARRAEEEKHLEMIIKSTAKDVFQKHSELTVINADYLTPQSSVINGYSGKLAVTDSIWAPWSYTERYRKP